MRTPIPLRIPLHALALLLFAAPSAADTDPATLQAVGDSPFDTLHQAPDPAWERFHAIHVLTPEVTFRKNWQRDQNRYDSTHVRDRDVDRIRNDVARLVQETLQEDLGKAGWRLADAPGEGILVIRPDIVDLDITAPDVPGTGIRETYSDSAGSMTLDLTIRDGGSGGLLLQATDHRKDPRENFLQWRKRPNNLHQARIMVRRWTRDLADLLGPRDA